MKDQHLEFYYEWAMEKVEVSDHQDYTHSRHMVLVGLNLEAEHPYVARFENDKPFNYSVFKYARAL